MAYHVYDPIYYKFMTNAVYDIQFYDMETSCMMWRKLNVAINKKGMGTLMFKGFMADIVQVKWNVVWIIHGTIDPMVKMIDKEQTCLFLWT
jgi:hypothetical protein